MDPGLVGVEARHDQEEAQKREVDDLKQPLMLQDGPLPAIGHVDFQRRRHRADVKHAICE